MLDSFREIYNQELKQCSGSIFEKLALRSSMVRMFVYEVCKGCVSQPMVETETQKPCRCCSLNAGDNFCANCGRDLRTA